LDALDAVVGKLRSVEGVMDVFLLDALDKKTIIELEEKATESAGLAGLSIVNEGAKDALRRHFVVCINHSPTLRHPQKPILVLATDDEILGQEVWEQSQITSLQGNPNAIFLGKGFVLFRDKLNAARKSALRFVYGPQSFPEIEALPNVHRVVSATVSPATDLYVKKKAGWDSTDPNRGTVLIGFDAQ